MCADGRYVPTDWASKVELTLEEVNRLNKLNLELASNLAARDPVYTPFQHGNFTCIMIKEVCLCEWVFSLGEDSKWGWQEVALI